MESKKVCNVISKSFIKLDCDAETSDDSDSRSDSDMDYSTCTPMREQGR